MKKRGATRKAGELNLNEPKDEENELQFIEEENSDDVEEIRDSLPEGGQDESKSGRCSHY
jgi:hypothetical protein